jgi:Tol biopolymer transport system component
MTRRASATLRTSSWLCGLCLTAWLIGAAPAQAAPDPGQIAFTASMTPGDSEVWTMSGDGSDQTQVTSDADHASSASLCGDTGLIAFARSVEVGPGEEDVDWGIFTVPTAGGEPTDLSPGLSADSAPTCAPDGGSIAFLRHDASPAHDVEIYSMDIDGSNVTQLTRDGVDQNSPAYSDDGGRIVYTRHDHGTGWDIWTMHADGSQQRQVTDTQFAEYRPDLSPSGRRIAFDGHDGHFSLFTVRVDGTHRNEILRGHGGPIGPSYSPDGQDIAFEALFGDRIASIAPDGSDLEPLASAPGAGLPDWGP